MRYNETQHPDIAARVQWTCFEGGGKVREWHMIIHSEARTATFAQQLANVREAEARALENSELEGAKKVMKRYFVSDAANQAPLIAEEEGVSVSIIQQPPLNGSKVAVWVYLANDIEIEQLPGDTVVASHGGYQHIWHMGMTAPQGTSAQQTTQLLEAYEKELKEMGCTLKDHCQRTWFFVRDVDTQYAGLVKARKENFVREGLTEQTHYIASTGIGGVPQQAEAIVQLGAYAIKGTKPEQVKYLYAPTHLNPTYEYGVTFERGTAVEYGDRKHIFISGTASIDNKGEVVHVGNIEKQTYRMIENVSALLKEAGADSANIAQIIVYLRDTGDYNLVNEIFKEQFPETPFVVTLAPVCRPTWLIEMECIALTKHSNGAYRDF